jgi:hypothetical protein
MRTVCWYRQQLFNCGHILFHRSYAIVGRRIKPVLVAVWPEGMKDRHLLVVTMPGTFLVLAVTVHMLHYIMGH